MKKRLAKKIYRNVCNDFMNVCLMGYTFGANPFNEERTVILDTPIRIYNHRQFKKACDVLNKPLPKVTFGSTPIERKNYRFYVKKENYHNPITCVPGNTQPPRCANRICVKTNFRREDTHNPQELLPVEGQFRENGTR